VKRWSLIIALVAVLSLAGAGCGQTRPPINTDSSFGGLSLAHPLIAAHRASIAAAGRAVDFPVPQARTAVAGPATLTAVWVNTTARQVALVYSGGDVTVMMALAPYRHPRAAFSRYRRENHATTRLGSVDGNVALVIAPRTDAKRSNPAWIEFDDSGVDINVVSETQGTAVLQKGGSEPDRRIGPDEHDRDLGLPSLGPASEICGARRASARAPGSRAERVSRRSARRASRWPALGRPHGC
jgi:hypothetical protein